MHYPKLIENLIVNLSKLPGVGRRSAERMVFWILNQTSENVQTLTQSITDLKENLMFCRICNNLSETEICLVCSDPQRDSSLVCVIESPKDLLAIERTGMFKGVYHVLLGNIAPADGRGPEEINAQSLLNRVARGEVKEVIIATDPDQEGEMTALYLTRQMKDYPVKISRIGIGLPVGSSLEFADMSTLGVSLNSRRELVG